MSSEVVGKVIILLIISSTVGLLFVYAQPILFKGKSKLLERDAYFSALDLKEKIDEVRFGVQPSYTMRIHLTDYSVSMMNEPVITINGTSYNVSSIIFSGENWNVVIEDNSIIGDWDGSTIMLQNPPIYMYEGTLTMPIISFNGSISAGGEGFVTITASLENVSLIKTGPAIIRIESSHYRVWRDFFQSLGLNATVSDDEVVISVSDSYIVLYKVRIE